MARRKTPVSRDADEVQQALGKSYLSRDLLDVMKVPRRRARPAGSMELVAEPPPVFDVILEVNLDFPGGASAARGLLYDELRQAMTAAAAAVSSGGGAVASAVASETVAHAKSDLTDRYVFARLTEATIRRVAALEALGTGARRHRVLHKVWLDREVTRFVHVSARTIKADAAAVAFGAHGDGIVWAVADTGIDASHPHFQTHATLTLPEGLHHIDFSGADIDLEADMPGALSDIAGHGTHVAGIIAGEYCTTEQNPPPQIERKIRESETRFETVVEQGPKRISGVAPRCKLMSLKVLNDAKKGSTSTLIAAIGYIQKVNENGRRLRVHGLNLSVGYDFEAEWFAAGKSPLCNEVDRLVQTGVIVVVAAGNSGFGMVSDASGSGAQATLVGTIADPGNAEKAITVGSTHRDMPHAYGVSYFSAKGPTADGRAKPDLLGPGERIVSCAAGANGPRYKEDSGTSMAAPHVSGAIAAFLSIRREFIGEPEAVKALLVETATDLKRLPHFQGGGLLDLMRAIQAR